MMTGEMFKAQQARLGLSNSQMADALGVDVSYVEHMRSGRRKVGRQTEVVISLLIDRKRKIY